MSLFGIKIGNSEGSPATGSVTLGDLAPLATFSVIGNQTGTSSTPTAVAMNCIPGLRSQATAAGTTTLVNTDVLEQVFTGATTQTVVLPVVTTLKQAGWQYLIINDSSGTVTVNSSGSNAVQVMAAGSRAIITCILLTGTSAASWSVTYIPAVSTVIADGDGNPITSNAVFDALALKAPIDSPTFTTAANAPTPANNDNDTSIATSAFVQGQGQGYLVYDATLTQTGTDAPTATVWQNNIGQTMTWGYTSLGVYTVTAGAAAFTANKTQIFMGCGDWDASTDFVAIRYTRTSTTVITINTKDVDMGGTSATPANGLLRETAIRIVIFP